MRHVLDTNMVLYQLANRLPDGLPPGEYFISIISEIELLSYPQLDAKAESSIRTHLAAVGIIQLTPTIKERTILIRRAHRLKLPDAVVAATALVLDAELISSDAGFARVAGLHWRTIDLPPS